MSTKPSTGRVRATYEFIKRHRRQFSVQAMCRELGVAQSGYYEWLKQPISDRAQEDARLLRLIRASFVASQGVYGAPRARLLTDRSSADYRICSAIVHGQFWALSQVGFVATGEDAPKGTVRMTKALRPEIALYLVTCTRKPWRSQLAAGRDTADSILIGLANC